MNQKGSTINSGISYIQGINPLNHNNQPKNVHSHLQPNKKLINTGKMVLNPYKVSSEKSNVYNPHQAPKQSSNIIHNRPTTTAVIKEDNYMPAMLQGKAMSLNTTKIPPREQMHSSHQNKGQIQNQPRKSQLNSIPKPQQQQQYQQQMIQQKSVIMPEQPIKIESQLQKPFIQQQPQQIYKKEDSVEGLTLDAYFKMPVASGNKQVTQEVLKIDDNQMQFMRIKDNEMQIIKINDNNSSQRVVHSLISDHLSESDRNIHSAGIFYNGDNDAEFFGYEMEEINMEKSIDELKRMSTNLSFNLMKCDFDDVRCSPEYEVFIQEIINYLHNLTKNNKFHSIQHNEQQIKSLQYFVFNGIEDCLYSRDINIQLILSLKNDIQNYPQKLVEAFAKRIENKFFMVEDPDKMDECFKLFIKYFHVNNYLNQTILNAILKFIKMKRIRDILCDFVNQQNIDELMHNENYLILLLTLKAYNCLPQKLPTLSIEKFSSNQQLCKLYKRYYQNNHYQE